MASSSQKAHEYFEQMRTRQIQLSSQRNAALLQQLNDLEEKVKESSLKTERLKLLREEGREEVQEAARNSKPPIPRKERQVHVGPLTSTPYRTSSPMMRGLDGIDFSMLHPDRKAPGSMTNSRTSSTGHLNYLRTMDKFPYLRTGENPMQRCPEKSTKFPVRHPSVSHSNPRFQRKIDNSIKSAKMAPDITAIPGCSSYKPNSQNFNKVSEKLPIEELSSDNEEFSDEEYSSDKVYEESPDHVKLMTKKGILENAKMETMIPALTESIFQEETLIRSKLPDKIKIPSKKRFLVNDESVSLPENQSGVDGSIDTQTEIHVDAGSMTKTKTQVIHEQSNQAENSFAVTSEQELSAKIAEAEIATVAEEIVGNMENEEIAGIKRKGFFSKNEKPFQPEFVLTEDMGSQNQENKVLGNLSTSKMMTETLEEPNIPMPSESSIPAKVEHLVEPENAVSLEEEVLANNESVNEENLEDKITPETITTNPDNLIKITETDDASEITEITPSPELFDTVRKLRTDAAIDKQEEKSTGGILSFLSSDEDDDDEDDSFFDSIPKPHAPVLAAVVQERMPNPQLKQNAAMKPEETSDTLSDEVDSDIDHQLANLVAQTAPIRFVEHELAQFEHELQKEESSPSKNPHLDRTTKDANSARSSESSLISLPNPAQNEKQPSQKLHQKLAVHLGLDTPYKISKPDLKKDEDKMEEDDFDFYD